MATKDEITDVLTDAEIQLAAARNTVESAQDLAQQYNREENGHLDEAAFRQAIEAINTAIQSLPQVSSY